MEDLLENTAPRWPSPYLSSALDVPEPDLVTGDPERDRFVFEADARLAHEGGKVSVGESDLYKHPRRASTARTISAKP